MQHSWPRSPQLRITCGKVKFRAVGSALSDGQDDKSGGNDRRLGERKTSLETCINFAASPAVNGMAAVLTPAVTVPIPPHSLPARELNASASFLARNVDVKAARPAELGASGLRR